MHAHFNHALRNTLAIGEALALQMAMGIRWNFLPGTYTEEAYSRTGSVVLSAGAEGALRPLTYEASVGGAFTNPDTTGVMRLLGMETAGYAISDNAVIASIFREFYPGVPGS